MQPATVQALFQTYQAACAECKVKPWDKLLSQMQRASLGKKALATIDLKGVHMTVGGAQALGTLLEQHVNLTTLILESTDVNDEAITHIIVGLLRNPSLKLQRLDLAYNMLTSRGLRPVGELMIRCSSLRVLDLSGSEVDYRACATLGDALSNPACQVGTIQLDDTGVDAACLECIVVGLHTNSFVTSLVLSNNQLGARSGQLLGQLLAANSTLTHLDLRYNHIGDHGTAEIAAGLQENNTLASLVLWKNELTSEGARMLSGALMTNTTLRVLDVGKNPLDNDGIIHLKDGLLNNRGLTSLGIASTKLGSEGTVALAEAVEHNCKLSRLDLRRNFIGVAGLMALSLGMKMNNTLTYIVYDLGEDEMETEFHERIVQRCKANLARAKAQVSTPVGSAEQVKAVADVAEDGAPGDDVAPVEVMAVAGVAVTGGADTQTMPGD